MARRRCQARRRGAGPVTYSARPMVANSRNRPGGQCCRQLEHTLSPAFRHAYCKQLLLQRMPLGVQKGRQAGETWTESNADAEGGISTWYRMMAMTASCSSARRLICTMRTRTCGCLGRAAACPGASGPAALGRGRGPNAWKPASSAPLRCSMQASMRSTSLISGGPRQCAVFLFRKGTMSMTIISETFNLTRSTPKP